jgi:hypothetical protein
VEPGHALLTVGGDERHQVVGGHRDRHRPELRLLADTQRDVDDAAVGGGDQHAPAFARRAVGLSLSGNGTKSKAASSAGIGRWRSSSNFTISCVSPAIDGSSIGLTVATAERAETDRDLSHDELARVELGAQRRARILRVDREGFH